ncbi:tail fiber protein [Escherichia phage ADB-2]|uniref:Peptidase S74 domain-containing protein n=1 Tax=Escherichia phage ADB-2 TaxID=1216926 RepID=K4NX51_9CAUD|nr:tail fiber protein [Escherichia phage ADB-2]AFV50959.1 hypothetical protein B508_00320 [Escherichia phage ADB-2]
MALYRRGTASMDADGTVHGTDTKWKDQLALIRVGATIVFLEQPIKLAVISDIVSDTELKAISTDGQTAADGKYVILLNDSLTVNGLAQNVAETLRYYQSKETEIAGAMDIIASLDMDNLNRIVEEIKANKSAAESAQNQAELARDSANAARDEANATKGQVQQIVDGAVGSINAAKDQAITDVGAKESAAVAHIDTEEAAAIQAINDAKGDLSVYVNNAQTAAQTATSAKNDAQSARDTAVSAKDAAAVSAQEAKDAANSVDASNLLKKNANLSDLSSIGAAVENLGVDRFVQSENNGETQVKTKSKSKWIYIKDNSDWGAWDNASGKAIPLPIGSGGTGRVDNVAEFRQFKSNGDSQDGLILKQSGSGFGGVCWADSADKVRWRMGINDAAGNFKWHAYDASGAYRDTFMEISGSGVSGLVCHRDITVRPTATASVLSFVLNNGKESVPAGNFRTMWDTVNINSNLIYKYFEKGDGTGFTVNWPSSGGVLALQGTSGRDFKKDISDADVTEAVARIEQMRMVHYVYKDDVQERVRFGIIAEEAEEIAPQYIKHREETYDVEVDPETNAIVGGKTRDRPSVDVNPIVMDLMGCAQYAIRECKRMAAEIEELKEIISELRG